MVIQLVFQTFERYLNKPFNFHFAVYTLFSYSSSSAT